MTLCTSHPHFKRCFGVASGFRSQRILTSTKNPLLGIWQKKCCALSTCHAVTNRTLPVHFLKQITKLHASSIVEKRPLLAVPENAWKLFADCQKLRTARFSSKINIVLFCLSVKPVFFSLNSPCAKISHKLSLPSREMIKLMGVLLKETPWNWAHSHLMSVKTWHIPGT